LCFLWKINSILLLDGIPYRRASIVVFLFSSCSILMRSIAAMFLSMGSSAVVGGNLGLFSALVDLSVLLVLAALFHTVG